MKLQSKILITLFSTLFIVSSITLVAYYYIQKSDTIKAAQEANIQLSKIVSSQLDQLDTEWSSILTYLQNHRVFKEYLEAKASGRLESEPERKAALEELLLTSSVSRPELIKYIRFIDNNGMEEVLVKNQQIKRDYKDRNNRQYFSQVVTAPAFKLSRPSFRRGDDYIAMDWGMAVSYENRTLGVLTMTLNPSVLNKIFDSLLVKGFVDDAYVTTWGGAYLFNTRNPEKVLTDTALEHTEAFEELMGGDTGAVIDSNDDEVMSYSSHEPFGIRFMLGTSKATMMADTMTLLKRVALLLFLSSIPLGIAITIITRKMIITRLQVFSNAMTRVSHEYTEDEELISKKAQEEVEALALTEKDELGDLSRSFIMMSRKLYDVQAKLDTELQRLQSLVKFGRLVGDEISEKECYSILIRYLSRSFNIDKIVVVSLNNSEDLAEVVATYGSEEGEVSLATPSCNDIKAIHGNRLCRAVRSGQDFIVSDVETEYRCPHQEVTQDVGSYMCTPISTGGSMVGWIHLVSFQKEFFTPECCFMINSYISTIAPAISSMRLIRTHRSMAIRDQLTGLYNRRFLEESLTSQISFAARSKQPLSLVMIDIDHFKRFNDLYGHKQGDDIMQKVSDIFLDNVRESDIVARYGGEEFIIIAPNTDKEGARTLAEKIRSATETGSATNMNGVKERVTISLGVSTYPEDGTDKTELMRQVDIALYRSKATGRNKVSATSLLTVTEEYPISPSLVVTNEPAASDDAPAAPEITAAQSAEATKESSEVVKITPPNSTQKKSKIDKKAS